MATKIKASNLGSSATTAITNIVTENSVDSALVNGLIDSAFTVKSTTDLSEGSNLYYTTSRGDSDTGDYIAGNRTYGNITTTGYIAGPATFTIDPAAVGDNTGTLIVAGNLQVDGTTTTINSTTMEVDDLNITLASGAANASAANGAGITVDGASATITYASASDAWSFNKNVGIGTSSPAATLDVIGSARLYGAYDTHKIIRSFDTTGGVAGASLLLGAVNSGSDVAPIRITGAVDTDGSAYSFNVDLDNSTKFIINSSGNVGIGTSSPSDKLSLEVGAANAGLSVYYSGVEVGSFRSDAGNLTINANNASLKFATGGTERMRIDSSGRLGIGTSSPDYLTQIEDTSGDANLSIKAGTSSYAQILLGDAGNAAIGRLRYNNADNSLQTVVNGSVATTIYSSGNVLHTVASQGSAFVPNTSSTWNALEIFQDRGVTNSASGIAFRSQSGTAPAGIVSVAGNTTGGIESLAFMTSTGNATAEAMRIDSSGNVGIGTTNPTAPLDVKGSGTLGYAASGTDLVAGRRINLWHGNNDHVIGMGTGGMFFTGNTYIKFDYKANTNASNGATRLFLDMATGNVGIGTSSPLAKLHTYGADAHMRLDDTNGGISFFGHDSTGAYWRTFGTDTHRFLRASGIESMRIDSSGRVTMPSQPAFHAYGTTSAWTVFSNGSWTKLVLAAAVLNTGNHYNTSSSAFTAPVTGVYHFYYKVYGRVQSGGGASTYWQSRFQKNNAGISGSGALLKGYQYTVGGTDETATYSMNISLAANDQITLHAQSAGSYNGEYYPTNCEFGGYLIG